MSAAVRVSELDKLIKLAYAANVPLLLEGTHGIGKSERFEQGLLK